jgi:hypothetical protein
MAQSRSIPTPLVLLSIEVGPDLQQTEDEIGQQSEQGTAGIKQNLFRRGAARIQKIIEHGPAVPEYSTGGDVGAVSCGRLSACRGQAQRHRKYALPVGTLGSRCILRWKIRVIAKVQPLGAKAHFEIKWQLSRIQDISGFAIQHGSARATATSKV